MKTANLFSLLALLTFFSAAVAAATTENDIHIDIPVEIKQAKVVFNMDHLAFTGDAPIGMKTMAVMAERFRKTGIQWSVIGAFQGVGFQAAREFVAQAVLGAGAVVDRGVFPEGAHLVHHRDAELAAGAQGGDRVQAGGMGVQDVGLDGRDDLA